MSGVNGKDIDAVLNQRGGALKIVASCANCCTDTETPLIIFEAFGYFSFFWISFTVMRPLSSYWSLTTRSFPRDADAGSTRHLPASFPPEL